MGRAKAHIVRTNMFLPVGASVIGLAASSSLTVTLSGSFSPGFTWVAETRASACARAVPPTRLATCRGIMCLSE